MKHVLHQLTVADPSATRDKSFKCTTRSDFLAQRTLMALTTLGDLLTTSDIDITFDPFRSLFRTLIDFFTFQKNCFCDGAQLGT
jgi:hypothetical protein